MTATSTEAITSRSSLLVICGAIRDDKKVIRSGDENQYKHPRRFAATSETHSDRINLIPQNTDDV